jgi:hypothetical protein
MLAAPTGMAGERPCRPRPAGCPRLLSRAASAGMDVMGHVIPGPRGQGRAGPLRPQLHRHPNRSCGRSLEGIDAQGGHIGDEPEGN